MPLTLLGGVGATWRLPSVAPNRQIPRMDGGIIVRSKSRTSPSTVCVLKQDNRGTIIMEVDNHDFL